MRHIPKHVTTSPTMTDPGRAVFVGSPADAEAAMRAGAAVVAAITDTPPDPVERRHDLAVASPSDLPADPAAWLRLLPPLAVAEHHTARIAGRMTPGGWIGIDFDGTLSAIVDDPASAAPVDGALDVIADLTRTHRVAIVSGRSLADLRGRVPVAGVAYAGSHGSEIVDPHGTDLGRPLSYEARTAMDRMRRTMARIVAELPGTQLDEKPTAIAIHTRRAADPDALAIVERLVADALVPGLGALTGKEVVEVRAAGRHKGDAVDILAGETDPVMYIGDDTTDEDAFLAVRRRIGVPIRVGPAVDPASTWASLRIDDPAGVAAFLRAFTDAA